MKEFNLVEFDFEKYEVEELKELILSQENQTNKAILLKIPLSLFKSKIMMRRDGFNDFFQGIFPMDRKL